MASSCSIQPPYTRHIATLWAHGEALQNQGCSQSAGQGLHPHGPVEAFQEWANVLNIILAQQQGAEV